MNTSSTLDGVDEGSEQSDSFRFQLDDGFQDDEGHWQTLDPQHLREHLRRGASLLRFENDRFMHAEVCAERYIMVAKLDREYKNVRPWGQTEDRGHFRLLRQAHKAHDPTREVLRARQGACAFADEHTRCVLALGPWGQGNAVRPFVVLEELPQPVLAEDSHRDDIKALVWQLGGVHRGQLVRHLGSWPPLWAIRKCRRQLGAY